MSQRSKKGTKRKRSFQDQATVTRDATPIMTPIMLLIWHSIMSKCYHSLRYCRQKWRETKFWWLIEFQDEAGRTSIQMGYIPRPPLLYTPSHLSEQQSCKSTISTNVSFIFIFKYCTTEFSHLILSYDKNILIFVYDYLGNGLIIL